MIPSALRASKISLLAIAILFNEWSAIHRRYKFSLCLVCILSKVENAIEYRDSVSSSLLCVHGHAPHLQCPKANLAHLYKFVFITNRYEANSSSTLFPHRHCHKSPLHITVGHHIKTIYRNAEHLLQFARVLSCKRFSLESGYISPCDLFEFVVDWRKWRITWSSRTRAVGTLMAIWWWFLADYLVLLQV